MQENYQHIHKLKQTKLAGLEAFNAIWLWNGLRLLYNTRAHAGR